MIFFHEAFRIAQRSMLEQEAAAFDSLKPGEDMVGLEQAIAAAAEEYRPGDRQK